MAKNSGTAIVWLRQDLRLRDQPALKAAMNYERVVPLYIYYEGQDGDRGRGGASKWWLHHSLLSLQQSLQHRGADLVIRRGASAQELNTLVDQTNAQAVFWNRCYDKVSIERDQKIKAELRDRGLVVESFNGALLQEPWEVMNKTGKPYSVFTPYWRMALTQVNPPAEIPAPRKMAEIDASIGSCTVDELGLLPEIKWDGGFYENWSPGEDSALKELKKFVADSVVKYETQRDVPSVRGTSRMSPHLHFGEISPWRIWREVKKSGGGKGRETYLKELGWRDFGYNLIFHHPHLPTEPLKPMFKKMKWKKPGENYVAWTKGQTGYPIVDAGMRELYATGWMHNRVRMIVASFLIKHLYIDWRKGEEWFWDTLVDADIASNSQGWQWAAGSGADAAPYFRIFNPILQGEKYDPDGGYVRHWVPELAEVPKKYLYKPWEAPAEVLESAGVRLGDSYPEPIVDHAEARLYALKEFEKLKG